MAFNGHMLDRIGPNATFPELQATPDIDGQYPMSCPSLRESLGANSSKMVLFKAYRGHELRQFYNSHTFWGYTGNVVDLGFFPHYWMIGRSSYVKLKYKMKIYREDPKKHKIYKFYKGLFNLSS